MQYVKNVLLGSSACLLATPGIFAADDAFAPVAVKADAFSGIQMGVTVGGHGFKSGTLSDTEVDQDNSWDLMLGAYLGFDRSVGPVSIGGRVSAIGNFYNWKDKISEKEEVEKSAGEKNKKGYLKFGENTASYIEEFSKDIKDLGLKNPNIVEAFSRNEDDNEFKRTPIDRERINAERSAKKNTAIKDDLIDAYSKIQLHEIGNYTDENGVSRVITTAVDLDDHILNNKDWEDKGQINTFHEVAFNEKLKNILKNFKNNTQMNDLNADDLRKALNTFYPLYSAGLATAPTDIEGLVRYVGSLCQLGSKAAPIAATDAAVTLANIKSSLADLLGLAPINTMEKYAEAALKFFQNKSAVIGVSKTPLSDIVDIEFSVSNAKAIFSSICDALMAYNKSGLEDRVDTLFSESQKKLVRADIEKALLEFFQDMKNHGPKKDMKGHEIVRLVQKAIKKASLEFKNKLTDMMNDVIASENNVYAKNIRDLIAASSDESNNDKESDVESNKADSNALYSYNYILDGEIRLGYVIRNFRPYIAAGGSIANITRQEKGVEDENRTLWGYKLGAGIGVSVLKNMIVELGYTFHQHMDSGLENKGQSKNKSKNHGKQWNLSRHGVALSVGFRI